MMDYLRQLFSFTFAISLMYVLLDCKLIHKKTLYLLGLFAAVVLSINGFVFINYGYTFFMKLFPLLVYIPVFFIFVFISSFKPIKVLFVNLTVIAICISFTSIGLIVSHFFGSSRNVVNIVCYILYLPTWFLIYKFIRPSFLYMMRNADKGWLGFCMIPLSYCVIIYSTGMYNLDAVIIGQIIKNSVAFFVLAFSAYYMIIRFFKQTREQLIMQDEQNLLITQVSAAQLRLEALKESQEKTVIYRHDLRHHMHYLNTCIAENRLVEAQAYIAKINNDVEAAQVVQYCENATVNLLLSAYAAQAKNNDIDIQIHSVVPTEISIHPTDICVILGNGIENAIRACQKIEDVSSRSISVVCRHENRKLMIEICNTFLGDIRFEGDIPASSEENHGLGVKSIVAAVQKYHGLYSFTADNGIFTKRVILQ